MHFLLCFGSLKPMIRNLKLWAHRHLVVGIGRSGALNQAAPQWQRERAKFEEAPKPGTETVAGPDFTAMRP